MIAASLRDLHYRVGNREVLAGVDVDFFEGEVVCLMGGEERSRLLRVLAGIDRPSRGSVSIRGRDPFRDSELRLREVGYMPYRFYLPSELNPEKLLSLAAYMRGLRGEELRGAVEGIINRLKLDGVRFERVENLSESMRKLLVFACSAVHRPSLLLLEEPTSRLSVSARYRMFSYIGGITDAGGLVVMTSSDTSLAAWIDRLLIIKNGRVVAEGDVRGLIKRLYDPYTLTLEVADVKRAIEFLSKIPKVRKVSVAKRGILRVWLDEPEETIHQVLALLDSLGIGVKRLLLSEIDPCNSLLEVIRRVEGEGNR